MALGGLGRFARGKPSTGSQSEAPAATLEDDSNFATDSMPMDDDTSSSWMSFSGIPDDTNIDADFSGTTGFGDFGFGDMAPMEDAGMIQDSSASPNTAAPGASSRGSVAGLGLFKKALASLGKSSNTTMGSNGAMNPPSSDNNNDGGVNSSSSAAGIPADLSSSRYVLPGRMSAAVSSQDTTMERISTAQDHVRFSAASNGVTVHASGSGSQEDDTTASAPPQREATGRFTSMSLPDQQLERILPGPATPGAAVAPSGSQKLRDGNQASLSQELVSNSRGNQYFDHHSEKEDKVHLTKGISQTDKGSTRSRSFQDLMDVNETTRVIPMPTPAATPKPFLLPGRDQQRPHTSGHNTDTISRPNQFPRTPGHPNRDNVVDHQDRASSFSKASSSGISGPAMSTPTFANRIGGITTPKVPAVTPGFDSPMTEATLTPMSSTTPFDRVSMDQDRFSPDRQATPSHETTGTRDLGLKHLHCSGAAIQEEETSIQVSEHKNNVANQTLNFEDLHAKFLSDIRDLEDMQDGNDSRLLDMLGLYATAFAETLHDQANLLNLLYQLEKTSFAGDDMIQRFQSF